MIPTTTPSKNWLIALASILLLCLGLQGSAATGTLMPTPFQTLLDANGNPVSNGKVCTYTAGTSTPATTYTDVGLLVANANPIRTDTAGRFVVYLVPGQSYKFVYQDSSGTVGTCDGALIKTQDNVSAVPASAANLDITGLAGEALTAGQAVYLSDGSAGKTAGSWYKADSAQIYSSVAPQIGMVPSSITSGQTGTIRIGGQMAGLSVTIGNKYYIGTAGAITATAPSQAREIGSADSSTTLVMGPKPAPAMAWVNDFRLTLTTALPVTTADVTAATTIFESPLTGNRIDLPDSLCNPVRVTSVEFSIAVPATTSQMYDVFAFNNAGVATLELLAWTNDTTRATAVARTNGRFFKSGDCTRMYLGSVRTTTVSGQTEDSAAKRYLWNYYNRVMRFLKAVDTTDSWPYSVATFRQANGSTANQVDVVVGIAEVVIDVRVYASSNASASSGAAMFVGIGEDSTTVQSALGGGNIQSTEVKQFVASLQKMPAVGRHFYAWLEKSNAAATSTWYGDNGGTDQQNGLNGSIQG